MMMDQSTPPEGTTPPEENKEQGATSPLSDTARLKKLVSSEQFDQILEIAGSKAWVSLFCCFGVLILVFIWSVVGSIPIKVQGNGISMTERGPYIIVSQIQGTVQTIYIEPGQLIEADTLIAVIDNPLVLLDIAQKKDEITLKQQEFEILQNRVAEEDAANKAAISKSIEATQFSMRTTESTLPFLIRDLESKKRLEQKGILSVRDVEEAKDALFNAQIQIEQGRSTLERLQADLMKSYRSEDIEAARDRVLAAESELQRLELQSRYLEVRAGCGGKVLEVTANPGDRIEPGAEIASVEIPLQPGEELIYYVTFGAMYGDLLDVDLDTNIEVSGVDPSMFGYLVGTIKFISPYPVTLREITSDVRSSEIATFLKGENALVYSAVVDLQKAHTVSGYKWTTPDGPPWELSSGTIGKVQTIVERKPPLIYVLPLDVSPAVYKAISHEK